MNLLDVLGDHLALLGGGGIVTSVVWYFVARRDARQDRVRERAEQAARDARALVAEIKGLYLAHHRWGAPTHGTTIQGTPALSTAIDQLRLHVNIINRKRLYKRLNQVINALGYPTAVQAFHGDNEMTAGHVLCDYGEQLLAAYLRGRWFLPSEPQRIRDYWKAIAEARRIEDEVAEIT